MHFKFSLTSLSLFLLQSFAFKLEPFIENIPPRCFIKLIHYSSSIESDYIAGFKIPLTFLSIDEYNEESFVDSFYQWTRITPDWMGKSECVFNLIFYYPIQSVMESSELFSTSLTLWITSIVLSKINWEQNENSVYALIVFPWDEEYDTPNKNTMLFNPKSVLVDKLAFTFLPKSYSSYEIFCHHNSKVSRISTMTKVLTSQITRQVLDSCSAVPNYLKVLDQTQNEMLIDGIQKLKTANAKILMDILTITNSTPIDNIREYFHTIPDFEQINFPVIKFRFESVFWEEIVLTDSSSFKMFTCYSEAFVSFRMYYSAFELKLWILLLVNGIILGSFLKCYIYFYNIKLDNFSAVLFYFSSLTEEFYEIPSFFERDKVYRTSVMSWLVLSVLFTNTYLSHVISELNSPLKGNRLKNISDIFCNFSVHSTPEEIHVFHESNIHSLNDWRPSQSVRINKDQEHHVKLLSGNDTTNDTLLVSNQNPGCFSILSKPHPSDYPHMSWRFINDPLGYVAFTEFLASTFWEINYDRNNKHNDKFYLRQMELLDLAHRHYPRQPKDKRNWDLQVYAEAAIEDEIIQCEKSIYLAGSMEQELSYLSMNYPNKRFYYFGDPIEIQPQGWEFAGPGSLHLLVLFRKFVESGIYSQTNYELQHEVFLKRRSSTQEILKYHRKDNLIDMTSSIQTIFIVASCMILFAMFQFAWEVRKNQIRFVVQSTYRKWRKGTKRFLIFLSKAGLSRKRCIVTRNSKIKATNSNDGQII